MRPLLLALLACLLALPACGGETGPDPEAPEPAAEGVTEEQAQEAIAELFLGEADMFTRLECEGEFPLADGERGDCAFEYTTPDGARCTGEVTVVALGRTPEVEDDLLPVSCV